ncbi:MAG: hypothetical protein ABWY17_16215, partial [Pseudomonas sp.]
DQLIETSSSPIKPANYLITKEFSVSSAPEEVRIIDRFERPSTVNLNFLQKVYRRRFITLSLYKKKAIEQYIAQ